MASSVSSQIVLRINGREVKDTFNDLKRATTVLRQELQTLTPGTEEFIAKSRELAEAERRFASVRNEIQQTRQAVQETTPELKNFGDLGSYMAEKFSNGVASSNLSFKSLGSGIKTMALEAWTAIGSIPVVGWIAAVVAAMGIGVSKILEYNEELAEANKLTNGITKLQGDALDHITLRAQNFKKFFDFEEQKSLEAARALVEKWKISYEEAFDIIEDGALRGGRANDEYLDSIREYPVFFQKAGFSAQEFINIINKGADVSVYSDKLPDALKEFDLSMREQTKSSRDALVNAFGAPFADELLKNVSTGKTTVKKALQEIISESAKYNLTQKQQAQLTADIFRGAGEDAGGYAEIIKMVTAALEEQQPPLDETAQKIKDQADAFQEMEEAKLKALKSDELLAFKKEMQMFWVSLQTGFFNFLSWIKLSDRELTASTRYVRGLFLAIPSAGKQAFSDLMALLNITVKGFMEGGKSIGYFITGQFDKAEESGKKFLATVTTLQAGINSIGQNALSKMNDNGLKLANDFRKQYNEKTKITADLVRQSEASQGKTNNFDGSEGKEKDAKKNADKAAKEAEAARKKAEAEAKKQNEARQKDLDDSLKAEADANNRSLEMQIQLNIEKEKLKEESYERDRMLADLERSKEFDDQRKQQDAILKNIEELEKKKADAKSPEAKSNYEEALKNERKLLSIHDQIIETSEDTHQKRLQAIKEKWDGKKFEEDVKLAQKTINDKRRTREQEITDITSLEDAKAQLLAQQDLKLTDQELRAIDNLEDAKSALREAADRAMLKQQEEAIQKQIDNLTAALNDKSLSTEAREKLAENLDFLKDKITQVKSAIAGGNDADAKKVLEEQKSAKDNTDILGFSASDWEGTFSNLKTTEGKIKALGMAFQALGNAGQMFSQLTQSLNERELRQFTKIQDAKKKALLKQLNEGHINREEYVKATEKLEVDAANKKAELDYKQAKADKIARIFSAIGSTAQAVATALTAGPIAGPILAAIVGALGAVQVGIIAAQPLPEKPSFATGGFTGGGFGSPDSSGYKPAGIVHENEWVAPKWMIEEPRTAKVIDYLESVRQGKTKPMADGGYSSVVQKQPAEASDNSNNDLQIQYIAVMQDVRKLLQKLDDEGIESYMVDSEQNGKLYKKAIKKFETIENRAAAK